MTNSWLEITTVSSCVIDCYYCPQDTFRQRYKGCKNLSLPDFKRALETVPKTVDIHFSGFSEPFLNPSCVDMVECASEMGHQVVIFSTLVGLDVKDINRLKRVNPKLILHLPDNLGNANIPNTELYRNTLVKVLHELSITDFSVMNERFINNQRAGLSKGSTNVHQKGWLYCVKYDKPQFVLLPNCDVTLCCMDFGLKHILGNLLNQPYSEIECSPLFKKIKSNRFHWDGDYLCRGCIWGSIRWNLKMSAKNRLPKIIDKL